MRIFSFAIYTKKLHMVPVCRDLLGVTFTHNIQGYSILR